MERTKGPEQGAHCDYCGRGTTENDFSVLEVLEKRVFSCNKCSVASQLEKVLVSWARLTILKIFSSVFVSF